MNINDQNSPITINIANTQYEIIKTVCVDYFNWNISENETDEDCDIYWQDFAVTPERFSSMKPYQKISHFPGMCTLSKKNNLAQNLNIMQKIFPDEYNFFPETWVLPKDYFDLKTRAKFNLLIAKPESSCQGKGIIIIKKLEEIPERCVVQRYIFKPFLIENLKFDLRLYVLLTGCEPLRIFLHQEGLVRFATEEYKDPRQNTENLYMHLTNYAINKTNEKFISEPNENFLGHKRKLSWFWTYLKTLGVNPIEIWREISSIIIKTIISGCPYISHVYKVCHPDDITNGMCFEVLGFDVLLDSDLKPWLLEVNHSPSFTVDAEIDRTVKESVIKDALILINSTKENKNIIVKKIKNTGKDRSKLRNKEFKNWKEKQTNKWKFCRDIFEQQQKTGFIKIYPDLKNAYGKYLDAAIQIFTKFTLPKQISENEEEIKYSSSKKKIVFPQLSKRLEAISKKKIILNDQYRKVNGHIFKALPLPKRSCVKLNVRPRKLLNSSGNFLIPKVVEYEGEKAPKDNKSFMKWKLIRQNLIEI